MSPCRLGPPIPDSLESPVAPKPSPDIAELCVKFGISKTELAELLGVDEVTLYRWGYGALGTGGQTEGRRPQVSRRLLGLLERLAENLSDTECERVGHAVKTRLESSSATDVGPFYAWQYVLTVYFRPGLEG